MTKNNKSNTFSADEYINKYSDCMLHTVLDINIALLQEIFHKDDTLVIDEFVNKGDNLRCSLVYIEPMVDKEVIASSIKQPILLDLGAIKSNSIDYIMRRVVSSNDIKKSTDIVEIIKAIAIGYTALLADGAEEVLIINTIGWATRAIEEPTSEKVLRGPREGLTESLNTNISMLRRKLVTPELKFEIKEIGVRSHTKVCITYMEGIVNPKILAELHKRLEEIDIDGVLGSSVIEDFIKDEPFSPFETIGTSERPDIIAGKLLEGRIAIIVEGTPVALTLPFIFLEHFQADEDYYTNFIFTSISRMLRIIGFLLTISTPAIYVALVTFHQELIPTQLILSIAAAKDGVPFPTLVETLGLLLIFEILREAGVRMPTNMGQALSIVGALVIGQAAVQARFISAPMVIVIATVGITGLMNPKLQGAILILRLIFLLMTAFLGLYGYVFGIAGLLLYLFDMRTFGVPYMLGFYNANPQEIKDTVIRAPWFYMKYRPKFISTNPIRKGAGGNKQ